MRPTKDVQAGNRLANLFACQQLSSERPVVDRFQFVVHLGDET